MFIELRAKNCFAFSDEICFSMKACMHQKKFISNVHKENNFNILKTAGIYGPNNSGKTCLVKCIRAMKAIMLNQRANLMPNIFNKNNVCDLGITFLYDKCKYSYDISYDTKSNEFLYEKFSEILKDNHGNEREIIWLLKDIKKNKYECIDKNIISMIPIIAKNNILCYLIDTENFEHLNKMKNIIINFANKIDIVSMNNIQMQKTIDILKNKENIRNKIVDFIKNSDLYMDNFEYVNDDRIKIAKESDTENVEETVLKIPENIMDQIKLVSTYKGISVPSIIFDSTGTKKIAAIAGYVIEALEQGRILVVDELDSSIHFRLTRAIVAMFNNELNNNAQMIFTVHDINLMDCKKLFRKDQIWFVHKDENRVYVYSLADFTAQQGIRDTTDIIEKYKKGVLGALPEPELINSLLMIKGNGKDVR